MRTQRALALLLAAPSLCGCALLQQLLAAPFEQPTLSFKEARLGSVDFDGAQLDLVFSVQNPNAAGLSLSRVRYELQVEGRPVVAGTPPGGLQIPAGGSADAVFPARVRWSAIAPTLQALFTQETVRYRASGELGVDTPIGPVTLPLAHEGTFAPPRLPRFDVGAPRLASLGLTGARLEVPLKIANGNGFSIPLGGVAGAIAIAGAPVGSVSLPAGPPIPAGQEATLQIPVEVDFLSAGLAVAQAIRSGQVEVKLDAELAAAGAKLPLHLAKTVQLVQ